MFDTVAPESASQSTSGKRPSAIGDPAVGQSVYTMPKEYLPSTNELNTRTPFPWKWALIIGGTTLVVLGIAGGAAAYVFIQSQNNTPPPAVQAVNPSNGNSNANQNTNNTNSGTPINVDVNANLAENVNEGLFPNNNSNTNRAADQSGVRAFLNRTTVPLAPDKDKDQLTDAEEVLYGSKVSLPDTDGDGFIDGNEVLKGYSPVSANRTLREDGLVLTFNNQSLGWTIDYPTKWIAAATDDARRTVLFTSDAVEGEFVQVSVVDNPNGLDAKGWYVNLFSDADENAIQEVNIAGLGGIVSPDGFTYYLADEHYVIGISYNFGIKPTATFKTTFEMMLSTFQYDPSTVQTRPAGVQNINAAPGTPVNVNQSGTNTNINSTGTNNGNRNSNTNSNINSNGRSTLPSVNGGTSSNATNQTRTIQSFS